MGDSTDDLVSTLRGRVLRGLRAGTLHDGDRLPSAREMVAEFQVDHRLILAAYRQLADEGLVDLRQRGGIYVTAPQRSASVPEDWVVDVLAAGFAREIPATALPELLRRCTETLRLRAAVVASTWDQVAGLCRELREDFGLEAEGVLAEALGGDEGGAETTSGDPSEDGASGGAATLLPLALRQADVLVTTEAHAGRMASLGQRLGVPAIALAVRPDLVAGEWALLLRRPVYAVVATEAFGDMLRNFFASTPGAENLHVVVFGRDDVSAIPDGAPTYVTRHVRDTLGGVHIPGRILPPARTIAARSARELLAFIVRANAAAMGRRGR